LGYIFGLFPPHRRLDSTRASTVLKNLLKAHVDVCHQLEAEFHGKPFYIGLVHNTLQFNSSWFLIRKWITEPLTYLTHELVMHFLETGQFQYRGIDYKDTRFKGNCCFINIYGDVEIGLLGPTCRPDQRMGDMHLALNPDSYARALAQAKRLQLPIYITETGIADTRDLIRPEFIIQFLRVVLQQLKDGMDIKALFFWMSSSHRAFIFWF
jgi:beta-glucosidase/6-phospho-beta-glucosidase/beta-galactosidase